MRPFQPLAAFPEHYHALIAFVVRRVGSRQTAQDLEHDAWLRVAEHTSPSQDHASAPRAYLYTVTERLVIDHLRHRQRTSERFDQMRGKPRGSARG